jgi:uncharacterized Zn finger protein (UPF0148 family)
MSSEDNTGRIRSAASLLVKGGTLTSEACKKCGGVQVRFGDKTTCINCGNEEKAGAEQNAEPAKSHARAPAELGSVASIIEEKIAALAAEIKSETDVAAQKQKADLLESYLRILEKAKSMMS